VFEGQEETSWALIDTSIERRGSRGEQLDGDLQGERIRRHVTHHRDEVAGLAVMVDRTNHPATPAGDRSSRPPPSPHQADTKAVSPSARWSPRINTRARTRWSAAAMSRSYSPAPHA